MLIFDDDEVLERAMRAYWRGHKDDPGHPQPAQGGEIRWLDKAAYVVLRNINGVLKVYQIGTGGRLTGLKEWPPALNDEA